MLLKPSDAFEPRHLGPTDAEVAEMCKTIGVENLQELLEQAIPAAVRNPNPMEIHDHGLSETVALKTLKEMMSNNVVASNFVGMGYHGTVTPGVIQRNLLENPAWYTAYTPYQAEIAQGRLESLVNFQTMVSELTGMECANASLLDEGTAAAEAMAMISRTVNSKTRNQFFVSDKVHPQTLDVMQTRAHHFGMELIVGDWRSTDFASMKNVCGALVQYPDTLGIVEDFSTL